MTNQEFENYLALVSRLLRLGKQQSEAIGCEMRDHLESRVAELIESGVAPEQATRMALEEFGDAASLAQRFQLVSQIYRRRWMMRFTTISLAAMFLLAVLVMAMWPDNARFGAPSQSIAQDNSPEPVPTETSPETDLELSTTTQLNQEITRKLTQHADLQFDEAPFAEVENWLETEYQFNIVLDQSAQDDSLNEDEPINCDFTNIPLKNALRLMLDTKDATYLVRDGVILIISKDVAYVKSHMSRRMFDCRVLLQAVGKQGKFGGPFKAENALAEMIRKNILYPGTYNYNRGGFGGGGTTNSKANKDHSGNQYISFFGDIMVVTAAEEDLDRIEDLLQDLLCVQSQKSTVATTQQQTDHGKLEAYLEASAGAPFFQPPSQHDTQATKELEQVDTFAKKEPGSRSDTK